MLEPILFYCRCKPYKVDLQELAVKHKRIFVGYVLWRDTDPMVALEDAIGRL